MTGTRATQLARAGHPGPSAAVTVVTAGLAVTAGHSLSSGALVVAAVLAGQLSIGWSNDLIDADRDRSVGRVDKPAATGAVTTATLRTATGVALVACIVLSLLCGLSSAVVHLLLGVWAGWAYNLGLKRTPLSPLPYAVAFGALPSVVTLALATPRWAPLWMTATGALLGLAAHLLNVLPDLADDARTGIRGLPHRLGERATRVSGLLLLTAGTLVAVLGPGRPPGWAVAGLVACVLGAAIGSLARGRWPFVVGAGIAVVDVVMLVVRGAG
ncbi:MAG: UbiA family prenyltransferase [Lapillicoccus sp.]